MTYRLSNRQQKELLIRGQRLRVALPVDFNEWPDALAFAKAAMPEHAEYIVAAEHDDVRVCRTAGQTDGVTGLMGHLAEESITGGNGIVYWVSVVIATLEHGRVRGEMGLQWAAVAMFPE